MKGNKKCQWWWPKMCTIKSQSSCTRSWSKPSESESESIVQRNPRWASWSNGQNDMIIKMNSRQGSTPKWKSEETKNHSLIQCVQAQTCCRTIWGHKLELPYLFVRKAPGVQNFILWNKSRRVKKNLDRSVHIHFRMWENWPSNGWRWLLISCGINSGQIPNSSAAWTVSHRSAANRSQTTRMGSRAKCDRTQRRSSQTTVLLVQPWVPYDTINAPCRIDACCRSAVEAFRQQRQ
jgi:hypothetical protein